MTIHINRVSNVGMITTYVIILVFSAWLLAYGLSIVAARVTAMLWPQSPLHVGLLLLLSILGFWAVVGAPAWLLLAALLLGSLRLPALSALFPQSILTACFGLTLSLTPLLAAPWLGAPHFIALDVALIMAAILGCCMAVPAHAVIGRGGLAFTLLIGWLIVTAAYAGAWVPAVISAVSYGAFIAFGLMRPPMDASYAT